jgi:prevent-host-death family protein
MCKDASGRQNQVEHRKFGELIRRAYSGREHFIVEKDGLPVVVILSVAEYEKLAMERERQDREERLQRFKQIAREMGEEIERRGITEEQMMAELKEIRREVYEEHYGGNQ